MRTALPTDSMFSPPESDYPINSVQNELLPVLEFTEAGSCQRQGKRIDEGQGGRIVLVVSFVLDGRIDGRVSGDVFPLLLLLQRCAGKWEYA